MYIFIYYKKMKADISRDIIEDEIENFLGERGEVTGGGGGTSGNNIDIELYIEVDENFLKEFKKILRELQMPKDTYLIIGKEIKLF